MSKVAIGVLSGVVGAFVGAIMLGISTAVAEKIALNDDQETKS